ncbi:hypothetical protein Trydic_g3488 [Trypoxylus dichotomus]
MNLTDVFINIKACFYLCANIWMDIQVCRRMFQDFPIHTKKHIFSCLSYIEMNIIMHKNETVILDPEYNRCSKPANIFNIDGTGVQLNSIKGPKVGSAVTSTKRGKNESE